MIKFKDNFAPERVSKTKPYRPDLPIRFGKAIIRKYLEASPDAIACNAEGRGYFTWSPKYRKQLRLVHVDRKTFCQTPKA